MVRSAFGDREHQSIFLTTGSPAEAGKPWEKWLAYSLQPAKAG